MDPKFSTFSTRKLIAALIVFLLGSIVTHYRMNYQRDHATGNWISYELPAGIRYEDCTATDEYMYFIHSGSRVSVAVFDLEGEFQHTLVFEDINKGNAYMRAEAGRIYVRLRKGTVFAFQGEENILKLDQEAAESAGYSYKWIRSGESRLRFDEEQLYYTEEDGVTIRTIPFPDGIRLVQQGGELVYPWNVIFLVLFAAVVAIWLYWILKRDKHPSWLAEVSDRR